VPKLGSVRELFAYARKQELSPEEFARRNKERQAEQWLNEQHQRDRKRLQELDADQAEIAAALHTARPGTAHSADEDWLATEEGLRACKGLRVVYRDAAPQPRRRRSA
jgi:septal ring factor EnvC (AmiA/AmiB activator)